MQLSLPVNLIVDGKEQKKTIQYDLYAVIVHHGHTVHSGHYIAYVKVKFKHSFHFYHNLF